MKFVKFVKFGLPAGVGEPPMFTNVHSDEALFTPARTTRAKAAGEGGRIAVVHPTAWIR